MRSRDFSFSLDHRSSDARNLLQVERQKRQNIKPAFSHIKTFAFVDSRESISFYEAVSQDTVAKKLKMKKPERERERETLCVCFTRADSIYSANNAYNGNSKDVKVIRARIK